MRSHPGKTLLALVFALSATRVFARGGAVDVRAMFHHGDRPVRVGRTPAGVGDGTSEGCSPCHAEIVAEWRESQHASAWTDEIFQAAYAVEPMQFCRNCHAPESRVARVPDARSQREGVSCSICHVRDGRVVGPGRAIRTARAHAFEPLVAMRTTAFCEGCHQFNFPGDSGPAGELFATDEPMQDTHAEWAMSASATRGEHCQSCHMPEVTSPDGRRHRSHRFPGGSDRALLSQAVRVEGSARVVGRETVVRVAVSPDRIGHSFPTGDLFRRAELVVWVDGDEAHAQTVAMARAFRPALERDPHGRVVFVRRQSDDTRVPPPGVGVIERNELRFASPARAVRWRLDHLLMPSPMAASQGFGEPRVRTLIAEGTLDVTPPGESP